MHRGTGGTYDKFIQTDASINQGNSGGPMFDMRGNVIGINSQILSPSGGNVGIGFAIPSEQAEPIVRTLMKGQTVKRGYLGVQISPLGEDLAESLGLAKNSGEFIQGVEPGKGADKAGIKAGDVIVSVNGQEVNPDQNLSSIVANQPIGSKVPIVLIRNGQPHLVRERQSPADMRLRTDAIRPRLRSFVIGFSCVVYLGVVSGGLSVVSLALVSALAGVALIRVQVKHEALFLDNACLKRLLLEHLAPVLAEASDFRFIGREARLDSEDRGLRLLEFVDLALQFCLRYLP